MIATVAWLQMIRLTRRGTLQGLRLRYALLVTAESYFVSLAAHDSFPDDPFAYRQAQAPLLWWWSQALFWQQMAVVLLAGPVFAAGAITDEKASGTLEHLLTTPMGDRELVFGKWVGL